MGCLPVCFFIPLLWCASVLAFHVGEEPVGTRDFISIDCGNDKNSNYSDDITGIQYVSDDQYTDAGVARPISSNYLSSSLPKQLQTLRSFPGGARNCYTLKPVQQNQKYLVRATFLYGDYDGLHSAGISHPLQFDLHIDVNFCKTVNVTDASATYVVEAVAVALADALSVCLINTGSGTPFISALELRPMKDALYSYASIWFFSFGLTWEQPRMRYPEDRYDRLWKPLSSRPSSFHFQPSWTVISTDSSIDNFVKDEIEAPSIVMQTAATPVNSTKLEFYWDFAGSGAAVNEFYANLHFSELLPNTSRAFNVYLNGGDWWRNYTPPYLMSDVLYGGPLFPSPRYQWAFNSTGQSTFPPILNALEVYTPMHLENVLTDSGDVAAITAIRNQYQGKRNWMGDACSPRKYAWEGLNCSFGPDSARITAINLSSSALTGFMSSNFALLNALEYIDLSYNNLTGSIPDALGNLPSLQVLDLTGNNLNGEIPASLLQKSKEGLLISRFDGNPQLCTDVTSCEATRGKRSKKISTPIIVILCLIPVLLLLMVIFMVWRLRKSPGNFSKLINGHRDNPLQLENRQFTYKELEKITNNFKNEIGKGGFGAVYHGCLKDGTQVAVKLRSQSSSQGTKEFLAEAQNLIRIHHKNLVSLVGYCMDGDHLALIYEFMSLGTLQDHLRDKTRSATDLSWGQRLQIAVEAALGLEYLHKGCKPPLVHRDVKTANILLSDSLEAKIADFGLSKAFKNKVDSHISTVVVGTPGYLDPEYYFTYQLSEKSDMYSFGVVLLELITGQPPILTLPQNTSLVQWMHQRLAAGNIEDVVDVNLQSEYDVNSIWKVADIAFRCTSRISRQRPTMTDVVLELKECLTLENARVRSKFPSTSSNNIVDEVGIEYFVGISPAAR